jgi:MFS family permease
MAIAPTGPDIVTNADGGQAGASTQPWPSEKAGFYILFCVIFATFLTFFDGSVFAMLAQRIKVTYGISDATLGFILGPANILAFLIFGVPLARLVDIYGRKWVLGISIAVLGTVTALGGLAQNMGQFIVTRMFVGAGTAANGPGSYSILTDAFRPLRIPLVFALLQLGYIGGTSIGPWAGGRLIAWTATWPETSDFIGLTVHNWQWVLVMVGLPGLLACLLWMFAKEPPRRSTPGAARLVPDDASFGRKVVVFTGYDALRAINLRGATYYPLFAALALSAIESQGLLQWRVPLISRTYDWDEKSIGDLLSLMLLVGNLIGVTAGWLFVTWLAKRHKDANIRATAYIFACATVCAILTPLMPTPELAITFMAAASMFGLAGAPAQNAAIQRVAPNEMRGQVTAFYLFMFTVFGAIGSWLIGNVSTYIIGDEAQVWKAVLIVAGVFMPVATFFMFRAIEPYREEVERLEALGL